MLTNFIPITNESIIAELTQRCVDKDEEIARLKALCCKPVVLTLDDVRVAPDPGAYAYALQILDAVDAKLKERK